MDFLQLHVNQCMAAPLIVPLRLCKGSGKDLAAEQTMALVFSFTFELDQTLTRTWHRRGVCLPAACRLQLVHRPIVSASLCLSFSFFQSFHSAFTQACDRNRFSFIIHCCLICTLASDICLLVYHCPNTCVFIVLVGENVFPRFSSTMGHSTHCSSLGQNAA